ncbi:MAG: hypothetical protein LBR80_17700 [Deltaproteobacteria bacterium]|jgi:hypothetical protein|nr:hypothetical protein [Deltaproteobacteria bacterium]
MESVYGEVMPEVREGTGVRGGTERAGKRKRNVGKKRKLEAGTVRTGQVSIRMASSSSDIARLSHGLASSQS